MIEYRNKTASYKTIVNEAGTCYRFFCDLSGLSICTTKPLHTDTEEEALALAWQSEGKKHFNQCQRCGKWVCDAMFNADVLECVACAPWENNPLYCPYCGIKLPLGDNFCRKCGKKLKYGEVVWHDD